MNIAVFGAKGRVGSKVVEIAVKRGHKVWEIDESYQNNPLDRVDGVIDFSVAAATEQVCEFCLKHNCPLVTGVRGRTEKATFRAEWRLSVKYANK